MPPGCRRFVHIIPFSFILLFLSLGGSMPLPPCQSLCVLAHYSTESLKWSVRSPRIFCVQNGRLVRGKETSLKLKMLAWSQAVGKSYRKKQTKANCVQPWEWGWELNVLRSREFPSVAVLKAEGKISFVLCLVHLFTRIKIIGSVKNAGAVG